ncbi:4a-hydroxytetrahydrobiopterin dehydratase [Acidianus brierleyi]|uniref:Putative pterin-4-alpha-carbinolamine dehydratase n=1 Tax=Acidianus brierleyi TaxID=41673 RepID=A0A2U9IBW1_9CREN|nr:4a-hydroxytetrahydrobiopterin dehydratase [Acidianus brierleyi]AWR93499.1 4a-hydroxytetrahydrobiopterin dehydratase [Acidianus brierleyi]
MKKLSEAEINSLIKNLKGWTLDNNKLKKEFKFSNFKQSINFLDLVEPVADSIDHHPDVCIYYNRVVVELTTHDVGGLSDLDFQLAEKMDELSAHVKT